MDANTETDTLPAASPSLADTRAGKRRRGGMDSAPVVVKPSWQVQPRGAQFAVVRGSVCVGLVPCRGTAELLARALRAVEERKAA